MTRTLAAVVTAAAALMIAGCDERQVLVDDYNVWDTGRGNQRLQGKAGEVFVADITAFAFDGRTIFLEVGEVGRNPPLEITGKRCFYKSVDTASGAVRDLAPDEPAFAPARALIRAQHRMAIGRSCVLRGGT